MTYQPSNPHSPNPSSATTTTTTTTTTPHHQSTAAATPALVMPVSAFPTKTQTSSAIPTPPSGTPAFQFTYPAQQLTPNSSASSFSSSNNQIVPAMTPAELTDLRKLVEDVCGIHLEADKQYLLETRLLKLLVEYDCKSYSQLVQLCKGSKQAELRPKLVDLMTTKETLWFRDEHPFETFKTHILPSLLKNRAATDVLRIWSAACSTGQEPYSIGMCVQELAGSTALYNDLANGQRLKIKGTDIAPSAIVLSRLGRYDMVAMGRGLSELRKNKFFTQQGRAWVVNDSVKKMVEFEQANLQTDLSSLGQFDVIFMRNVAIYFSKEFKIQLYAKLAKQLKPNGYLIIGSTESLVGIETPFKLEMHGKTSFYRLKK
jgi:chemotaxis protein methyltransferase CheR